MAEEATRLKILVPLDGSTLSEAALPVAERIAREQSAQIVLLTVGELPETSEHRAEEHHALRQIVDPLAKRLESAGLEVAVRTDMGGDAAAAIRQIAEEEGAAQIVMTTHGRSGLSRLAHGSVADAVLRAAPCPVTLVRPGSENLDAQRALITSGQPHEVAEAAIAVHGAGEQLTDSELQQVRESISKTPEREKLPLVESYLALLQPAARRSAVIDFLEHGDAMEREAALSAVDVLDDDSIADLARLTTSDSRDVRWAAFEAIRAIGGPAAVVPLISGLRSEEVSLRWIASHGLTEIGQPSLRPLLRALATEQGTITFHRAAFRVLRRLRASGHEQEMTDLLNSLSRGTTVVQSPPLASELLHKLD